MLIPQILVWDCWNVRSSFSRYYYLCIHLAVHTASVAALAGLLVCQLVYYDSVTKYTVLIHTRVECCLNFRIIVLCFYSKDVSLL